MQLCEGPLRFLQTLITLLAGGNLTRSNEGYDICVEGPKSCLGSVSVSVQEPVNGYDFLEDEGKVLKVGLIPYEGERLMLCTCLDSRSFRVTRATDGTTRLGQPSQHATCGIIKWVGDLR